MTRCSARHAVAAELVTALRRACPQEASTGVQAQIREVCARAQAGAQEQERLAAARYELHATVPELKEVQP